MQSLYGVMDPYEWLFRLDSRDDILGFEDVVIDIAEKAYREDKPDDMLTLNTRHSFSDVQSCDQDMLEEILFSFASFHESDEVFRYVMKFLATSVTGDRPKDTFHIWSGPGANGKSISKTLMAYAFGKGGTGYYYEPDACLFAQRSVSGSCLNSALAKLKGKRICMPSEGESGDKLRAGLIKNVTGHDRIQARDIYKSASELRSMANFIFCVNEISDVDDISGGIERRLLLVNFPFKFVEKKIDDSLHTKISRKDYGACLLKHFIDLFTETCFDFETPQCVKPASSE